MFMNNVRFCVFSDLHYRSGDWNWASKRLETILGKASAEQVDFIMHCGDFCHNVVSAKPIIDRYNNFPIPAYHTMGNHDFEQTDGIEIVAEAYQMKKGNYYFFDLNGIRMISLDINYYHKKDGTVAHYASSDPHDKCHQTELIMSPEEEKFLQTALAEAPGPCVIFSHPSLTRPDGISNKKEIRHLLESASAGKPVLWINGHYHRNNLQVLGNTAFFDLNSTTSDWLPVAHHFYGKELLDKFSLANHVLLFDTPLYAIVTVSGDGTIRIEGTKGKMYQGFRREDTENSIYDAAGLPCDPNVLSAHFKLIP